MLTNIASLIHPTEDLARDREFWRTALGVEPYFDQPFYVGFRVGEAELGLDPDAASEGLTQPVTYWEVADITAALALLEAAGATAPSGIRDLYGLRMATITDRSGRVMGVLQRTE